jgi:hypothetical protein
VIGLRLDEKKKTGRPLRLTEARFRRMIVLIREGNTNARPAVLRELPIRSGAIIFKASLTGEPS